MIKWIVLLFLSASYPASATSFEPELIGGTLVDKSDYPEIVWISSSDGQSQWTCSATVISPQVILTAGHCVQDQGSISPVRHHIVIVDSVSYSTKCWQAPLYRDKKEDHDMALCKVDHPLHVKPASVSKQSPKIGDEILLTGYGCIASDASGGNDGTLRIGKVPVTRLPSGKNHWFYTKGKIALCYGDSGGPSMIDEFSHKVIGVNSRGNIVDSSLLTALFTRESIAFMESFVKDHGVDICGISKSCH